MPFRFRRLPRTRTLLLATYVVVLMLPLAGIGVLRLYESALVSQTEAELLAQGAVLSAAYRAAWTERAPPGALADMPKAELPWGMPSTPQSTDRWTALFPQLDMADTRVLARAPEPQYAGRAPEPVAAAVGRALDPMVADVRRMTLAGIRVVDSQGSIVASTVLWDRHFSLRHQEEIAQALRGAPVTVLRERLVSGRDHGWDSISRNTAVRVYVAVPVVTEGRVLGAILVSRTPRSIGQTLYNKRYALFALGGVLVLTVAALAWFAGYTVVRPTRQLADMAKRVARGDIRAVEPLASPMTREAQSLSDSIVTMARTLEARTDYVRDLALGISHEFKTPLTGIRGGAELLRDHLEDMSAEERAKFLSNILADTDRLERLVRRILELARVDALGAQGDAVCDVARLTAAKAADARGKGQRVEVEPMPETLPAAIDNAALDVVLSNLFENAQQHGGAGVRVQVAAHREAGEVIVDVRDDGAGVSPGNAARIFDRFFTTARDGGGTGLGLAIVRRQLATFGGDIDLVPSARGAAFRIRLKAAA